MAATIVDLLTLMVTPPARTDVELAQLLSTDLGALRERLHDLRRRGILGNYIEESAGWTWKCWFASSIEVEQAAHRSGLAPNTPITMPTGWWAFLSR